VYWKRKRSTGVRLLNNHNTSRDNREKRRLLAIWSATTRALLGRREGPTGCRSHFPRRREWEKPRWEEKELNLQQGPLRAALWGEATSQELPAHHLEWKGDRNKKDVLIVQENGFNRKKTWPLLQKGKLKERSS